MGVIVFNGVSSKDLGIRVATPPEYQIPERDISTTLVPGRNGEAILNVGAFKNVKREYSVSFPADIPFSERAATIARWLFSSSGYARLQDSYDPNVYRMAFCQETTGIESLYQEAGRTTLSFSCRPERFLLSGEEPITMSTPGKILNPTGMATDPLLKVYGAGGGKLTIGEKEVSIKSLDTEYLAIDCHTHDAFYLYVNKNDTVSIQDGFPKLGPSETYVTWSGGVTKIEIIPRWWSL